MNKIKNEVQRKKKGKKLKLILTKILKNYTLLYDQTNNTVQSQDCCACRSLGHFPK